MSVIGIGNALTDIIIDIPSQTILDELGFPVGGMYMIDEERHHDILNLIGQYPCSYAAGGSAANTIGGLARLGVDTAFVGKVGSDDTGKVFADDQQSNNIESWLEITGDDHSGKCISMVLPGGERTMATYLGSSITVSGEQLTGERLEKRKVLYVEGYIVYNRALIENVMRKARQAGLLIALDMASYNVVEENLEFLKYLVAEYVDIIFANQDEAFQYTSSREQQALEILAAQCRIAVVKIGARGSLVACGSERVSIGVIGDAVPRDKTGAGDLYASGFLYGLCKGLPLAACGALGAVLSSKVIEIAGPKMTDDQWREIHRLVAMIERGERVIETETY